VIELILVGNDPDLAVRAIDAGINRCLVDLEILGKSDRQHGRGTFIARHSMEDVERLRAVLPDGTVEVRVDRLNPRSKEQIDRVINAGADIVMLPMVESIQEAGVFIDLLGGRVRACLLVETVAGIDALDALASIPGVHEFHIGLNDLMISSGDDHLFGPFADRQLEAPARHIRSRGLGLGIGGITVPGQTNLPVDSDQLIGELVRLDVTLAWLGRSFHQAVLNANGDVSFCVDAIRESEQRWRAKGPGALMINHELIRDSIRPRRRLNP
jgi:hypothetical protein